MIEMKEWDGFEGRLWKEEINVRQFIQDNYTPYDGDESFLADPTDATNKLWDALQKLQKEERAKGGVLDMETEVVTGITAYGPGYIDESLKDLEQIVGLQTDKPLKRAFMPYGGIKMAVQAAETYGYNVSDKLKEIFTKYHKTHNTAVFDAYTPEMMKVRHAKILTGLPDTYGRGRIVGDYRRVALYGLDYLIEEKKKDKANCGCGQMTDDVIRLREEIAEQIKCLEDMKKLAEIYGYDISRPATNAKEAVQWLYFGYLAAIKTQNGAAMSVGRVSTFLDIYIKRDMDKGILTEQEAQELIDHFTMKLRMVKFARIPSYNQLFSGDPVWATLDVAGTGVDGRSMVTKTDFRFLHTLENMGPAPEPNLTVFYSSKLPQTFKDYAARISIETPDQIAGIKESAKINVAVLDYIGEHIHEGMNTAEIDKIVYDMTTSMGGIPAPLNYEGYPYSVCTSVNEQVCHGFPSKDVILKDGDIINVDCSTILNGYFSDSSRMYCIGNVSPEKKKLVEVTKECVELGLKEVKPWGFLGDMGQAVHDHAFANGYTVVREIGGHGVGLEFHEDPWVGYNTKRGTDMVMAPGMIFTIEPMVNMGKADIYVDDKNNWEVYTDDGLPSAQWEIMVLVTEDGHEVLSW